MFTSVCARVLLPIYRENPPLITWHMSITQGITSPSPVSFDHFFEHRPLKCSGSLTVDRPYVRYDKQHEWIWTDPFANYFRNAQYVHPRRYVYSACNRRLSPLWNAQIRKPKRSRAESKISFAFFLFLAGDLLG